MPLGNHILLVDDDVPTRYAMAKLLGNAGFDVTQAHDFRDALRRLDDPAPLDLLVVDLVLPGVNGFALARMARMKHRNLKTIYITAFDDIPTNEAMGPILRKPVRDAVLLSTIQQTLAAAGKVSQS